MIRKLISKYIYILYFFIVLLASCGIYQVYIWLNTESTDNAYVDADISYVSSEVSGVIDHVIVQENNFVEAGQLIARINDSDYLARYKKMEANLDNAKHNIELITQDINLAEIRYKKSLEARQFAETSLNISKTDYNRISKLNEDNFASQKKLDNSTMLYEKEKHDLSQAILDIETNYENIKLLETKKMIAISQKEQAMQEYLLSKRALENTNLKSPITGIIGNSSIQEGNYIRSGVVLFSVIPTDKLYIKANFKETQVSNLEVGMKTTISFDSLPGVIFNGVIRNISPATGSKFSLLPLANATGNFTKIVQRVPVIIDFKILKPIKDKIVPGMSSLVTIRTDQILKNID